METTAEPRSVLVVGDSLAIETEAHLAGELPGTRIETFAAPGKTTADGVAELEAAGPADAIVISLGTNDDPEPVSAFGRHIERVLAIAGPSACVIWADIVSPPRGDMSYDILNDALREAAAKNSNLVVLAWTDLVRAHPEWLTEDGIHLTREGYRERARALARMVRTCGK